MQRIYNIKYFKTMELQVADSLKIIQSVINQRKQKYEENGFFLIFWSVLIMLAGIIQFVMLITDYYPKQSGFVWLILMPIGFFYSLWAKIKSTKRKKAEKSYNDWTDWLWFIAGINAIIAFIIPWSIFDSFLTAFLIIYLPFTFVTLTMALQMKMKLWIATCLLAFIIIYAVQFIPFSQEVFLPLLSSFMAGLLFLVPGIQFHNEYKKRNNVC